MQQRNLLLRLGVGGVGALWVCGELLDLSAALGQSVGIGVRSSRETKHMLVAESLPKQLAFTVTSRSRFDLGSTGLTEWPGARVLLQHVTDTMPLTAGGTLLEIGSGVGTAAVGIALAAEAAAACSGVVGAEPLRVVATDVDEAALALLRHNASQSDCGELLRVEHWDAATGCGGLKSLPVPLSCLTHVVGSDVVYFGGAHDAASPRGLVPTLAALLEAQPLLDITLVCMERFPVERGRDPALLMLEEQCRAAGLHVSRQRVPKQTVHRVQEAQRVLLRVAWQMYGLWDSIWIYKIRRLASGECGEEDISLRGELSARHAPLLTDDQFWADRWS